MNWLIFAGLASASFTGFAITNKFIGSSLSPFVGQVVMLSASAIAAVVSLFIFNRPQESVNWLSYWPFVIAGVFVFGINLGYAYAFAKGAPVGLLPAVVNLSSMVVLMAVGAVVFKESLSLTQWLGFALACVSVYLMTKGAA